jgi:hypothetical protein
MSYLSSNLKEKVVLDVASLLAFGTHLDAISPKVRRLLKGSLRR